VRVARSRFRHCAKFKIYAPRIGLHRISRLRGAEIRCTKGTLSGPEEASKPTVRYVRLTSASAVRRAEQAPRIDIECLTFPRATGMPELPSTRLSGHLCESAKGGIGSDRIGSDSGEGIGPGGGVGSLLFPPARWVSRFRGLLKLSLLQSAEVIELM
jgi:hypothetical protein